MKFFKKEKPQVMEAEAVEARSTPQKTQRIKPYKSDLQIVMEMQRNLLSLENELSTTFLYAKAAEKGQRILRYDGNQYCDGICKVIDGLLDRIAELERNNL